MPFPHNLLPLERTLLKGQVIHILRLNDHFHTHKGKVLIQVDDVLVQQTDAPFTGTARHTFTIVRTAVNAESSLGNTIER